MHRNTLLKKMENYEAFEQEKEFKSRIISFVKKHKDCFERSLEIGHITASCWLLNNDHTKALLMHHTKLDMWVQPGGHCDGDSDVVAVALKEAREESGIQGIEPVSTDIFDIDIHLIPENSKEKAHYQKEGRWKDTYTIDFNSGIQRETFKDYKDKWELLEKEVERQVRG